MGGGGGSSGAVSWPTYLQNTHADWLTGGDGNELLNNNNMTAAMERALGTSPLIGANAYPPDSDIAIFESAVAAFSALLSGLDDNADWTDRYVQSSSTLGSPDILSAVDMVVEDAEVADTVVDDIVAVSDASGVTDAEIILDVDAFANQLDDEILTKVLPRFRRGMQDINAVVSSAFVIGASNIEGFRDRDVSRHNSTLRVAAAMKNADVDVANMSKDIDIGKINVLKNVDVGKTNIIKDTQITTTNLNKDLDVSKTNMIKDIDIATLNIRTSIEYKRLYLDGTQQIFQAFANRLAWEESYTRLSIESNRIKIVAKSEQVDNDHDIDIADSLWDLEVFQYGANLLAAPGGGTMATGSKKVSKATSAIGGAISGAAAGAVIGSSVAAGAATTAAVSVAGGVAAGAATGAAAGSVVPVYGTIIGAVVGAAAGLLSAR